MKGKTEPKKNHPPGKGNLTLVQLARKKFHEGLLSFVPVVGHIPPKLRVMMGVFYLICLLAIFVALFVVGYRTDMHKVFLSPSSGDNPSQNCNLIPVENSGRFLASQAGFWQRASGFVYSDAAYYLSLSGYTTNKTSFGSFMDNVRADLQRRGELAKVSDVAHNMLYWMGWSYVDPVKPANRMYLYGDPLVIFDRDSAIFTVSNSTFDCMAPSVSEFTSSTGEYVTTFNINTFTSTPGCARIMNPNMFGYDTISRPPSFTLSFDVRMLAVSMAVNSGAKNFSDLVEVAAFRRNITDLLGITYLISRFYDPKFPGMDPVGCILSLDPPVCIFRRGLMGAIPIFHHVGRNVSMPDRCNCTLYGAEARANPTHPCNIFRFIAGFIYWGLPAGTGIMSILQQMDIKNLHAASYDAAFITSTFGRSSPLRSIFATPEKRRQAFQFCTLPSIGPCSIATFSSYDISVGTFTISPDYLQLVNGACRDSFTPSDATWNALKESPYAELNQAYQECRYSSREVLQNQAGITFGNLQIIAPLLVVIILMLVLIRQYLCCLPSMYYYNKAEKDGALDDFAIAMLMTRDGRMDDYAEHHQFSMARIDITDAIPKRGQDTRASLELTAPFGNGSGSGGGGGGGGRVAPAPAVVSAPAPSAPFLIGHNIGNPRLVTVNNRGRRMRASFTSQSIIHNIVVELAMNARRIAEVDNREAVDFIKPVEADNIVKENLQIIEEEEDLGHVIPFDSNFGPKADHLSQPEPSAPSETNTVPNV